MEKEKQQPLERVSGLAQFGVWIPANGERREFRMCQAYFQVLRCIVVSKTAQEKVLRHSQDHRGRGRKERGEATGLVLVGLAMRCHAA